MGSDCLQMEAIGGVILVRYRWVLTACRCKL